MARAYESNRTRQTLRLLRVSLIEAILLFDVSALPLPRPLQIFLGCSAIFFGLGLARTAAARFASGPALILDDQGFQIPHAITGRIQWSSVTSLKFTRSWPIMHLYFHLKPDGTRNLRRHCGGFLLAPRKTLLVVNLRELVGSPEAIAADAQARWERARR